MRISDWSSDVCSSDLLHLDVLLGQLVDEARGDGGGPGAVHAPVGGEGDDDALARAGEADISEPALLSQAAPPGPVAGALVGEQDRKSVVEGKRVSVRVGLGDGVIVRKKKKQYDH